MSEPSGQQIALGNFIAQAAGQGSTASIIIQYSQRDVAAPAFQIPYPRNPLFLGRDREMEGLAKFLGDESPEVAPVALTGMSGIGKTQLAVEFAHRFRNRFPGGIFWLNMEHVDSVADQVADCAGPGGLNLPGYAVWSFEERIRAVRAAWQQTERRLLVFDNMKDSGLLQQWRPSGGGCRVLITTQRAPWAAHSGVHLLPLLPLTRSYSVRLLLEPRAQWHKCKPDDLLADPKTATAADAICASLGDLPLAIALAGAYLEEYPSVTLAAYQTKIQVKPLIHQSLNTKLDEELPTRHISSILQTFALSYQPLQSKEPVNKLARALWHAAAQCAPEPIPRRLLLRAVGMDPDNAEHQQWADRAFRRLASLGLIEDLRDGRFVLHRLLAAFAQTITTNRGKLQAHVEQALLEELESDKKAWNLLASAAYREHLRHMLRSEESRDDVRTAALKDRLARVLSFQGASIEEQRSLVEGALEIRKRVFGSNHPATADSFSDLAALLEEQGDHRAARTLLEHALKIREQELGPDHPLTAASLNNLAWWSLQNRENLEAIRPLLERALDICERQLDPNHPDTATVLSHLALLLQGQGKLDAAHPLFERVLAINETVYGPDHPFLIAPLNNLGQLLSTERQHVAAHRLFQRALHICQQQLGSEHPITAFCLNNVAIQLYNLGDYAGARSLFEETLTIHEKIFTHDDLSLASTLFGLAMVLYKQGDQIAARPLVNRLVAIDSDHPAIAAHLNNLAMQLQSQGDLITARRLFERALAIMERQLGPEHPDTAFCLNNLGVLLRSQGEHAAARSLFERALAICEQQLGSEHSQTQAIRDNVTAQKANMTPQFWIITRLASTMTCATIGAVLGSQITYAGQTITGEVLTNTDLRYGGAALGALIGWYSTLLFISISHLTAAMLVSMNSPSAPNEEGIARLTAQLATIAGIINVVGLFIILTQRNFELGVSVFGFIFLGFLSKSLIDTKYRQY